MKTQSVFGHRSVDSRSNHRAGWLAGWCQIARRLRAVSAGDGLVWTGVCDFVLLGGRGCVWCGPRLCDGHLRTRIRAHMFVQA